MSISRTRAAAAPLLLLLAGCTGLFLQPSRHLFAKPEDYGYRYEVAHFKSADGTELTGMFFFSSGTARGTVVHFHGNGENMTTHFLYTAWLAREGWNVFIFDYRGYGASGGKASVGGAVADGAAALRYVRSRPGVDPERLAVFGQSLGGALAVAAVAREPAGVRALILESPFSSYRSIAQEKLAGEWITWPLQWPLAHLLISDHWSPMKDAPRLPKVPKLVIHGDADEVVPVTQGRRLYAALGEPKQFWLVAGGRHTEAFVRFAEEYRPRLVRFLESAFR